MGKINDAIKIITALGYPAAQQNERSALSLLALVQLKEKGSWKNLKAPQLGIRAILDFCRNDYEKHYAENSRESFRKETLHQFVSGGLVLQNPDDPNRAPNSPKWCYQISPPARKLLETYKTASWRSSLTEYLATIETLADRYKAKRDLAQIPCVLPGDKVLKMSPGSHSKLIKEIIELFAPRFAPGCQVLYIGDTGNKGVIRDESTLQSLGLLVHERGKMPDVILYRKDKEWIYLVECVTSVGPVDAKRHAELKILFEKAKVGLVFVTAFPNRTLMARFLTNLAWETEVWCSDNPDHLIHLNGDRFLGPH